MKGFLSENPNGANASLSNPNGITNEITSEILEVYGKNLTSPLGSRIARDAIRLNREKFNRQSQEILS